MKQAIIIGAGPAGLTAAHKLLQSGDYKVTVFEATNAIGGISQTVKYNGHRMDIGGHRFFSKDPRITSFWLSILPLQSKPALDDLLLNRNVPLSDDGRDPETEDKVMLQRNRVSRIFYKGKFFDYPVTLKWDTLKNMGFLTTIKAGFSYISSRIKKKPETNLENFYINRFGKVLYSMFFEKYTEKLWGRHPSEISADWGAQRVKGLSVSAILKDIFQKILHIKPAKKETSLIDSFMYPKYGPGQLWETVAEKITEMGGEIKLNCKVEALNLKGEKISSVEYLENGEKQKVDCDLVFSSMPLDELINDLGNDVPKTVKQIANGLPFRDFVTVGLLVDKLSLKNKTNIKTLGDIVPDCWIYVQDPSVKLGRLQIFNNWSPYLVKDPQNTVWIGLEYFCNQQDDIWSMSDQDFIDFAIGELCSINIINREDVILSHREKIKKAYPAYFDTYNEIDSVIDYLNKIENLYCIGRNGQHRYNNMDHSMLTAFVAVDTAIKNSKDKSDIWVVNTEKDYHEEK